MKNLMFLFKSVRNKERRGIRGDMKKNEKGNVISGMFLIFDWL